STLLRIIAGLDRQTKGEIRWNVLGENPISHFMVFQDYSRSLFPWFTVRRQLTYARDCIETGIADPAKAADRAGDIDNDKADNNKIDSVLKLTGLTDYADMLPNQLSGGMKQRVALASDSERI
ncbi:MAG: ATP-binding cassette domain-containing protein, partial [Deltaproteobacteria bacterium]|nr:ATP-binding cassette domain-containing protein [Deltaproteobacteria bacterium]